MYYPVPSPVIEFLVLGMVGQKASYGYDICQQLRQLTPIKESTLYPILKKMELNGWLSTYTEAHQGDNGSITNQLRKGMNSCYFWRRNGCVIRQLSQHWQKEKQNDEARFLQVLEHDLSSLPVQAREEALAFFTEYLAEVGESSDALAELGDPHQVAQDLLSEMKAQGIPMEMREVMVLEDSKVVVTKKFPFSQRILTS